MIILFLFYILNLNNEKFTNTVAPDIKDKIIYGLKNIDELFNQNDIYYTAAYGTLLGAVRHWDMIPWDDDADINVLRKDYTKIMGLKDEFKKRGLILKANWKLIKIYFDDTEFPFIDIFINDVKDNKIVRCSEPFENTCTLIDKSNVWWWKWVDYPADWILKKKRFKFGPIEIWGPQNPDKILKFWYGEKCLTECQTNIMDHVTGNEIEATKLNCGNLPKLQL